MAEPAPLTLETGDEDLIEVTPVKCNILRFVPFLLYILYVQVGSALVFALALVGIVINPGTVCAHLCYVLCCKFATTPGSSQVLDDTQQPVIFLCNHRSWGDFFTDNGLLGGPSFVARWLVIVGLPFTGFWGWTQGWIWFFSRGVKRPEGTTKWMLGFYQRSHSNWSGKGMVVYPEGTRGQLPWGNPLKHGGLAVAHTMGWPVQCIVTTNKENVMLESKAHVAVGFKLVSSVSAPIRPQDYATTDDFIAEVETTWRKTWKDAYTQEGIPRDSALLPGAVNKAGAASCPGGRRLNIARLVVVVLVLFFTWNLWLPLFSGEE